MIVIKWNSISGVGNLSNDTSRSKMTHKKWVKEKLKLNEHILKRVRTRFLFVVLKPFYDIAYIKNTEKKREYQGIKKKKKKVRRK